MSTTKAIFEPGNVTLDGGRMVINIWAGCDGVDGVAWSSPAEMTNALINGIRYIRVGDRWEPVHYGARSDT